MSDTDPIGDRIRASAQSVSAPLALRESIGREPARRRTPPRYPGRLRLAGVGATLAIIATMAALLAPGPPSVARVATAALHAPQRPATAFQSYLPGFTAVGQRTDTVAGRTARTVIYRRGTVGIHYTIVDGKPLDLPGKRHATVGPLWLSLTRNGDVSLVTWHAGGKTCILASRAASPDQMVALLRRA
jgi:hypothetical protein